MVLISDQEGNTVSVHWNTQEELVIVVGAAEDICAGVCKLDKEDIIHLIGRLKTVLKEFPNE